MHPSCNDDTSCGRCRAGRQTAARPPAGRTHDRASPRLVPARVRLKWYGYLALTGTAVAIGAAPAWALVAVALACLATPLALAASHGRAALSDLFLINPAPGTRRPNTEPKEST